MSDAQSIEVPKLSRFVSQVNVEKIKRSPELMSTLQKTLPILCEMGGWSYAEVWTPEEQPDGRTLVCCSPIWYAESQCAHSFTALRRASESLKIEAGAPEEIASKVFATKKAEWFADVNKVYSSSPYLQDPERLESRIQAVEEALIKSGLGLPVLLDGDVLAVFVFLSLEEKGLEKELLSQFNDVVLRLVKALGKTDQTPSQRVFKSTKGAFQAQMNIVFDILQNEGVFNSSLLVKEIDYYYNHLGWDDYYFRNFPPGRIAKHIHSFISAKKLAATSGRPEDVRLNIEQRDSAFYICPDMSERRVEIEERLESYIFETRVEEIGGHKKAPSGLYSRRSSSNSNIPFLTGSPSLGSIGPLASGGSTASITSVGGVKKRVRYGKSVAFFRSAGTMTPDSSIHLNLYIVSTLPYVEADVAEDETDLWKISTGSFLRDKTEEAKERYGDILRKAIKQLTPVFQIYDPAADRSIPLMIAFKKGVLSKFLSSINELMSINNIICITRFIETFSNGYIVCTFYVFPKGGIEDCHRLFHQVELLSVLPDSPSSNLLPLMRSRSLSVQELAYAYAASAFAYYFLHRQTEEYTSLASALRDDHLNLSRLTRLHDRLRKDLLTESRIAECIFQNPDLIKEMYTDFANSNFPGVYRASPNREGLRNDALLAKIKKTVSNEVDEQIFLAFTSFNRKIMKTNFYKSKKAAISFRLDPSFLLETGVKYPEVPFAVFFLLGSDFRGFHIRFREIARGGIRVVKSVNQQAYIRNLESLFDENFNLAYTQQNKNKDIPEGGSKGVVLLNVNKHPDIAFKKYVDALLDLLLPNTQEIVDRWAKTEILFLGPDENTADLMDWAALHARSRGYPFWKAFTTGKSMSKGGIPHDLYGMTTRSIHQYVLGILEQIGVSEANVTKFQTGGPDGDLGSNEVKISHDKTIGIVDGSGVLFCPDGIDRDELSRLANTRKPVSFFNTELLGAGGFLVRVEDRDMVLPDGTVVENGLAFRNDFHLLPFSSADLFVPCGGRPNAVHINNVSKLFKKDGTTSRFKYIVEGANLFFTQDARLELEKAGVIIFKDASANKGGVTSSSLEVLAALALNDAEFEEHMQVKGEYIPPFYQQYVQEVQLKIEQNARMEFMCIWSEKKRTGTPSCILTDHLSRRINEINDSIQDSKELWENSALKDKVMFKALPLLLVNLLSLQVIYGRVPDAYLKAIFSSYLASHYVYKFGLSANEFQFFEFLNQMLSTQE